LATCSKQIPIGGAICKSNFLLVGNLLNSFLLVGGFFKTDSYWWGDLLSDYLLVGILLNSFILVGGLFKTDSYWWGDLLSNYLLVGNLLKVSYWLAACLKQIPIGGAIC
jgi:hypothetical protein